MFTESSIFSETELHLDHSATRRQKVCLEKRKQQALQDYLIELSRQLDATLFGAKHKMEMSIIAHST